LRAAIHVIGREGPHDGDIVHDRCDLANLFQLFAWVNGVDFRNGDVDLEDLVFGLEYPSCAGRWDALLIIIDIY
jgi:hypothetical protein